MIDSYDGSETYNKESLEDSVETNNMPSQTFSELREKVLELAKKARKEMFWRI